MNKINSALHAYSLKEKMVFLVGFLGYCGISYRYRNYLGDFGDFVKAGELIWKDMNPYQQLAYVNSPVSALIAFAINKALPFLFFPLFWQFLNLAALVYFFRVFGSPDLRRYLPLIVSIFAFLNVARALFGNGQVTGLVLGLFALGVGLVKRNKSVFLSMIPVWLAFEVKPQLAVAFVLILCFEGRIQKSRILVLTLYVAISHVAIEFLFVKDINSLWIQKILKYSSASLAEGYEISLWKGLTIYSGQVGLIRAFSLLSVLVMFAIVAKMAQMGQSNKALFVAILLPLQNSYLHLYDLAPLGLLFALGFCVYRESSMIIALCLFVQVFPITLGIQLGALFILLVSLPIWKRRNWKTAAFTSLTLLIVSYLSRNLSEELQIINLLVFPAGVIAILKGHDLSKLFNPKLV